MTYVISNILNNFLTFYSQSLAGFEATLGIRVEVAIACALTGIYLIQKTKNFWKTFFGIIGVYSIIYFHMALPSIFYYSAKLLGIYYLLKYPNDYVLVYLGLLILLIPTYIFLAGFNVKKFAFIN